MEARTLVPARQAHARTRARTHALIHSQSRSMDRTVSAVQPGRWDTAVTYQRWDTADLHAQTHTHTHA
jgi:hypothetical protein